MGVLWENSAGVFIAVTVVLGGGASYLTGRAVAITWRPIFKLVGYVLLLTAATRFIHYALFEGTLVSLHYFVVDFIVLFALGFFGYRVTRARQMTSQYGWLYTRVGPFNWRQRPSATPDTNWQD
ncbi:DUF6867 family protein [Bauldia sp.]|uniref:DUF6867 family protein n=1 Tax=Bauldia sp. TaxID=2575872 RepID=UPI003BAC197F